MKLLIRYFTINNNQFQQQAKDDASVKWICVEEPTQEEIQFLITNFALPTDYVTGVLDDEENSRFEGLQDDGLKTPALLLLQYPFAFISPSGYPQTSAYPISMILTSDDKILTIANHQPAFIQQITQLPFAAGAHFQEQMVLHFAWQIALSYHHFLKKMQGATNKLESELKVSTENSQLYQIMDIKKGLVYFEAAIEANQTVLQDMKEADLFAGLEMQAHDVLVEIKQSLTTTRIQLTLLDKMSETFSAIVSNNLNNVMKILTSLTIVLTIPTIMGGIFGMNVKLPFANREDAFWWIFAITTVICLISIRALKKKSLL